MISEKELREAIAECQGQRNPNADTCMKLASYYTILDHIKTTEIKTAEQPSYSFANEAEPRDTVRYQSGTEFSDAIYGMDTSKVIEIMDELMDTLSIINPPLYNGVMRRVTE